jgi:hypothetical protein
VIGQDGASVNDFLVTYLDPIDKRLLAYLDNDDELSLDTVRRLRLYTSALLAATLTPAQVMEDWPDWFDLAPAFVAVYGTPDLEELEYSTSFVRIVEEHDVVKLTEIDRAYLRELELQLDIYPEMRAVTGE